MVLKKYLFLEMADFTPYTLHVLTVPDQKNVGKIFDYKCLVISSSVPIVLYKSVHFLCFYDEMAVLSVDRGVLGTNYFDTVSIMIEILD